MKLSHVANPMGTNVASPAGSPVSAAVIDVRWEDDILGHTGEGGQATLTTALKPTLPITLA